MSSCKTLERNSAITLRNLEEKRRLLMLQKRSGKSVSAFGREHGLCEQTFCYWRGRLRPERAAKPTEAGFAEVAVAPPATSAPLGLAVYLPTGVTLEIAAGADALWVGQLIRELQGS